MEDQVGQASNVAVREELFVRLRKITGSTAWLFIRAALASKTVAALLSGLNFAQAASDFGTRQEAVAMVHRVQWAHRLIATTDYD